LSMKSIPSLPSVLSVQARPSLRAAARRGQPPHQTACAWDTAGHRAARAAPAIPPTSAPPAVAATPAQLRPKLRSISRNDFVNGVGVVRHEAS
jgi:hypothetical protein